MFVGQYPFGGTGGSGGVSTFLALTDTPNSYLGFQGKVISVKSDASGLEFITMGTGGGGSGKGLTKVYVNANYTTTGDEILITDSSLLSPAITLPSLPQEGAQVIIVDAKGTFAEKNVTVNRNGKFIGGVATDLVLNRNNTICQLIYSATAGDWKVSNTTSSRINSDPTVTSIITNNYNANAGDVVLADVSLLGFSIILPASPSLGDVIEVIDIAGVAEINNITVNRNGQLIHGKAENFIIDINSADVRFIFGGVSLGWRLDVGGIPPVVDASSTTLPQDDSSIIKDQIFS